MMSSSSSPSASPAALPPKCLNNNPSSSYLKSYPYLFVRETNQTDYFCTLCDSYLKEEELQAHLFEVHQANNIEDFFVRVTGNNNSPYRLPNSGNNNSLYICVVCWAKIPQLQDTRAHRSGCKVNPTDEDLENGSVPMQAATKNMNGFANGYLVAAEEEVKSGGGRKRLLQQCCSLCTVPVAEGGQQAHLRDYHRINVESAANCPLCNKTQAVTDLSSHLSSAHGVQTTAANAILFWVISSLNVSPVTEKSKSKSRKTEMLIQPPSYDQSKLNNLLMSPPKVFKTDEYQQQTNGHHIPTVLQTLLSKGVQLQQQQQPSQSNLAAVETIVSKFTRCHFVGDGKESIQCLICSKWFAVPPVKHLRGHMVAFTEENQRIVPLIGGCQVCIICYDVFDSVVNANNHLFLKHNVVVDGGRPSPPPPPHHISPLMFDDGKFDSSGNELPTVIEMPGNGGTRHKNKVELDNAGRVKSGKVRKQCELCGEWSNIKWFFKHMSEVHQALFCRCCREYLPIHEHEEHKHWHSEPPYMGQKIRIESNQPVIIDRKERASLTPIGSLASWGGSSGGKVVKAVDTGPPAAPKAKKRKSAVVAANDSSPTLTPTKTLLSSPPSVTSSVSGGGGGAMQGFIGHMEYEDKTGGKDTLMPKEVCPVCGILITYKNLARHIKLRHKIKYKFCHKCRKLVPNTTYEDHKSVCNEIVIDGSSSSRTMETIAEDEDYIREESLDPTDFLEASASADEDDEEDLVMDEDDSGGELVVDTRKSEEFRANNSKNKLESLMGKEFKHPRRRCAICGYSVSYSNFKRHLRNAHPAQYQECERAGQAGQDFKRALASLSQEIGDCENEDDEGTFLGHVIDEDEDEEDDDTRLVECAKCGDRIREQFLDRHMKMNHAEKVEEEDEEDVYNCPVCTESFDAELEVLEHCRKAHEVSYKWCRRCSRCVPKRDFDLHLTVDHGVEAEAKGVFNCPDCNHLFLAESGYKSHLLVCRRRKASKVESVTAALEDAQLPAAAETRDKETISDEILKD